MAEPNESRKVPRYYYKIHGNRTEYNIKAPPEQIEKVRKYFQQGRVDFPDGISGVDIHKDGSVGLGVRDKSSAKISLEKLGFPPLF